MMKAVTGIAFALLIIGCAGCGPGSRRAGGRPDTGEGSCSGAETTPETCSDGIDNNCNGLVDCADPSCSGIGSCPVCGMIQHPTGSPVDLPDGIVGSACSANAQCSGGTPNCVESECHGSYTSTVNFTAFGPTQQMMAVSDIVSVCANMSHEWIRDLEIQLKAPSGQIIRLQKFLGRTGGEAFLGHPLDTDGDCTACTPEQGFDYCWKPTATNPPILDYINAAGTMQNWNGHQVVPAGDYNAADPWSTLIGATLNGGWQIIVTDLWPEDKGVIHSWTIAFNPMIVQNCSGPVIQ